ncbi:MAG: calcium-binding protein, partial [Pseudomonadota bacterium]
DSLTSSIGADTLEGGAGDDTLYASDGADILDGGAGDDRLDGGIGNDTYLFGRDGGNDTVWDYDWNSGNSDTLQLGADIDTSQIWLQRNGNDLRLSLIGRDDSLTIGNWYTDQGNHIERIRTADGQLLLDNQVDLLVNAMAAFTPPVAGQTTLPQDYRNALQPVLAANWN